jgi:RNA polymerase sigma-70 factor (sigma-E family)
VDSRFVEFVHARHTHLLRRAYLLIGDHAAAEDLLQDALVRVYRAERRRDIANLEGYVLRAMANLSISRWRRPTIREHLTALPPERPQAVVEPGDGSDVIWEALRDLPRQQRAVLVLRFFEDLPESTIANILGVGVGTVRSHSARGLARLRLVLGERDHQIGDLR